LSWEWDDGGCGTELDRRREEVQGDIVVNGGTVVLGVHQSPADDHELTSRKTEGGSNTDSPLSGSGSGRLKYNIKARFDD